MFVTATVHVLVSIQARRWKVIVCVAHIILTIMLNILTLRSGEPDAIPGLGQRVASGEWALW